MGKADGIILEANLVEESEELEELVVFIFFRLFGMNIPIAALGFILTSFRFTKVFDARRRLALHFIIRGNSNPQYLLRIAFSL